MLKDHLLPNELIEFERSSPGLKFNSKPYDTIAVSNRRIIFYRVGEFYKRDIVEAIEFPYVTNVKYKMKGLFKKRGVIEIQTDSHHIVEGDFSDITRAFRVLSKYTNTDGDDFNDEDI